MSHTYLVYRVQIASPILYSSILTHRNMGIFTNNIYINHVNCLQLKWLTSCYMAIDNLQRLVELLSDGLF